MESQCDDEIEGGTIRGVSSRTRNLVFAASFVTAFFSSAIVGEIRGILAAKALESCPVSCSPSQSEIDRAHGCVEEKTWPFKFSKRKLWRVAHRSCGRGSRFVNNR